MSITLLKIAGAWLLSILGGFPLWASMAAATLAFLYLGGFPLAMLPQKMAGSMNSFPIVAAPLFILMGNILGAAKITDHIVDFASAVIGWVRGGYAHASVLSSIIFAGMVGSAVADAAGSGRVTMTSGAALSPAGGGEQAASRPATASANSLTPSGTRG